MKRSLDNDNNSDDSIHNQKQRTDNDEDTINRSRYPIVRIMLHTEDGIIPYLTPDILERYFPPSTDNIWCLGIAMNETCVTPIYQSDKPSKKQQKQQQQRQNEQQSVTTTTTTKESKPRGYIFSADGPYQLDSWLYPYERIVVPTFDNNPTNNKIHQNECSSSSSSSSLSSSLRLWTSNGRHTINTKQYTDCAISAIHATMIVPLHESIPSATTGSLQPLDSQQLQQEEDEQPLLEQDISDRDKPMSKSNLRIVQQNQTWIKQQLELLLQQHHHQNQQQQNQSMKHSIKMSLPFVVSSSTKFDKHQSTGTITDNYNDQNQLLWILDQIKEDNQNITLIGWNHIQSNEQRWNILQSIHETICSTTIKSKSITLGTISSSSTQQIIQFLQYSILPNTTLIDTNSNTSNSILIGTNLPSIWARSKRCFVVNTSLPFSSDTNDSENTTRSDNELLSKLDMDGCFDFNPIPFKDVKEHIFYSDTKKLMSNCTCITCQTYTRAYLFHLVCSKELLVEILFFIHNLHHLLHTIRRVNEYHNNNDIESIQQLRQSMQHQLGKASD